LWSAQQSNGQNLQQDTGMSGGWLGRTAILLLMALATATPANADSPGSELERLPDADHTFTSPDG
jgi:hypothetical protein